MLAALARNGLPMRWWWISFGLMQLQPVHVSTQICTALGYAVHIWVDTCNGPILED